jgi:hypothetical protein
VIIYYQIIIIILHSNLLKVDQDLNPRIHKMIVLKAQSYIIKINIMQIKLLAIKFKIKNKIKIVGVLIYLKTFQSQLNQAILIIIIIIIIS